MIELLNLFVVLASIACVVILISAVGSHLSDPSSDDEIQGEIILDGTANFYD